MTLGSTPENYLQQLQSLTPTGGAFPTDDAANWTLLLTALANTYARIDTSAVNLLNEIWPDTTQELLPNWERILGIPDECSNASDPLEVRRSDMLTKLTNSGGQSIEYFIGLAAQLGFTITITEFSPFRVGINSMGQPISSNKDWWFVWQVNSALNTIVYFRAGQSSAQDPLEYWSNARLECFIARYAPAHTRVQFEYT